MRYAKFVCKIGRWWRPSRDYSGWAWYGAVSHRLKFQQGQRRAACSTGYWERTGSSLDKACQWSRDRPADAYCDSVVESRLSQTQWRFSLQCVLSDAAQIEYLTQSIIMESSTRLMFAFILFAAFITHCYAKSKLFSFMLVSCTYYFVECVLLVIVVPI